MPEGSTNLIKPEDLMTAAKFKYKENQRFLSRMKSVNPKELDKIVHQFHEEVFSYTDCLTCANCCKTISPAMRERDVERIASALLLKPVEVVSKYMQLDADGDYVFVSSPCPFLEPDNRCKVYNDRPKACREYPHTDRRKFYQLLDLTLKNTAVCPAVFAIVEKMKSTIGK
jgi:uncharacterized protein